MDPEAVERRLAAILSADVAGYSRLMAEDEAGTIRTLRAYHEAIRSLVEQHQGRVVDAPGDNLLAEFPHALGAVQGAVEIQRVLQVRNQSLPAERRMLFRIGVHLGDITAEEGRIYGDGVNIAARLEGLAEAGGICISDMVLKQVESKLALGLEDLGEQSVKNIPKPVRAYRIQTEAAERAAPVRSRPERRGPRALIAVLVLLMVAGAAAAWLAAQRSAPPAENPVLAQAPPLGLPDRPSIAVLPFENMSGDPEQEYFADGMTEDLITDLSRLSGLLVVSRNSVFVYKGRAVDPKRVSEELGVRYLVEGSVRKAEDRVRITAQLIDAASGHHLWAERFDRKLEDIFAVQEDVTRSIAGSLNVALTAGEAFAVARRLTVDLEAYDAFLRGLAAWRPMTPDSVRRSRELFTRAIELDPDFAWAYGMLAASYWLEGMSQWSPGDEALERAFALSERALSLDESVGSAGAILAWRYVGQGRFPEALAQARRAVATSPNDPDALSSLAAVLNFSGRPQEAIPFVESAIRRLPHWTFVYRPTLAESYRQLGRLDEAIAELRQSINESPDYLMAHLFLARIYADLGREEEAQREGAEVLRQSPDFSLESMRNVFAYADPLETERMSSALHQAGLE